MMDSLWRIFWPNRNLFGLISAIAAGIIKEIATKNKIVVGIFTALRTFGIDLKRNVNIHLSVTCRVIDDKGNWRKVFFPAEPIKKMLRHRILELFRSEYVSNNLQLPSVYQNDGNFNSWMSRLYEISWYVYLQKPSDDQKRNVNYLGRYFRITRYYGFLSNRTRGRLLSIVYKAINQIAAKKIKIVSWRLMMWLSPKKDQLFCNNCNQFMHLRQIY